MIALGNHLWQSTLFLAGAALLALVLRKNRAQVRYWIWFAASMKFLAPFAVLTAIGSQIGWQPASSFTGTPVAFIVEAVSEPFSQAAAGAVSNDGSADRIAAVWPGVVGVIWLAGFAAMLVTWRRRWRRMASEIGAAQVVESGRVWEILRRLDARLPIVTSDTSLEPGVFGIRRPVLWWPQSITARLSDEQIEAILLHELAHVRRGDNVAAAAQMAVQAVFWFHPLVWWLAARLIEERERACDEDVIERGSAPHVYAEGILKTCAFYVESPLVCAAGVTGADLKRRIEQIMRRDAGVTLSLWRKAMLATAAAGAIGLPIVIGAVNAPALGAQSPLTAAAGKTFEVVSIKSSPSGNGPIGTRFLPSGQYVANNVTLRMLISNAYGGPLQPLLPGQLVGGPEWIDRARFDVLAKSEAGLPAGPNSPLPEMIRNMLSDRFRLVMHPEKRAVPIFTLVLARTDGRAGPQLNPSAVDCSARGRSGQPPPPIQPGDVPVCGIRFLRGNLSAGGVTMAQFANALSRFAGRVVIDQTGLSQGFNLDLKWTPEPLPVGTQPAPGLPQLAIDPDGPSLFTALQEQLGLKLVSQQGQVDVLVVDQAELPTADDFESVALPPPPPPPPPPPGP